MFLHEQQKHIFKIRSFFKAVGGDMAYRALYRKYRPSRFADVIGQEHITNILKNQIKTGRIAHAYLFSGSRGTGKTTTARILARAINCLDTVDGEPCGKCKACSLSASDSIDIIEMDAASNSKVDEMRALLDKAEFAPIYLKTKVYIIDEAHMLSKSANNALLKTLEEPPAHVVFILATTEPQSLPLTILSRCQRFEFHRITAADMAVRTRLIAEKEGITVDDEALMCIARASDGAMRDCLSILDQCLSFCGDTLTRDDVLSVLGSMNTDFLFDFADDIIRSDAASVMKRVNSVVAGGRDIGVFVQDLASHFRALLITKLCGECEDILEYTKDTAAKYLKQSKTVSKARLERALEALMLLQSEMRYAAAPRILLESTLLKICHPEEEQDLTALEDRIEQLETKLREGNFVCAPASGNEQADSQSDSSDKKETAANDGSDSDVSGETEPNDSGQGINAEEKPSEPSKPSPETEALYKKFMAAIMDADITTGIQLQLASSHWCDNEILYLCFDKSKTSNYNYANGPEVKTRIRHTAAEAIAPYSVELVLRDGNAFADAPGNIPGDASGKSSIPKKIFGVTISEE